MKTSKLHPNDQATMAAISFMNSFCRRDLTVPEIHYVTELFQRLNESASGRELIEFTSNLRRTYGNSPSAVGRSDAPQLRVRPALTPSNSKTPHLKK